MATKTIQKKVKSSESRKIKEIPTVNSSKKHEPSEEEIRELAEIFYHQRIDRTEYGTAEEDWLNAEEFLRNTEY